MSTIQGSIMLMDAMSTPLNNIVGAINTTITALQNVNNTDVAIDTSRLASAQTMIVQAGAQLSEIKKTIRASETGTMRFQASQEFRVYKKNKDDKDFEEKQKIFINNLKKELEEKNIKFDVKEDDREWRFYINYKMDAIGKVAKLENHDKVLQETSNKLMDLKVDLFISHTKEVRKKSFGESVGDFGESVKDGACEVFEVGVLCLTAPI